MTVTTFAIYSLEAGLYKTWVCVSLASLFFGRRIPHSFVFVYYLGFWVQGIWTGNWNGSSLSITPKL